MSPAWPCAVLVTAVCALATLPILSLYEGRTSALVRMAPSDAMAEVARETDPSFVLAPPSAHYDGVYFYTIARDPLALGPEHLLIDRPAYRYGHAGYGLLAAVASLGQEKWIPLALLLLGLGGAGAAAAFSSILAKELGFSAWAGLGIALNPGIVYSVTVDTSESIGAAFLALSLLAWFRRRWVLASIALIILCLTKETFLVVPAGLALYEIVQYVRHGLPSHLMEKLLTLASGPLVFACWYVYLRYQFGVWPHTQVLDIFAAPLAGWVDSLTIAAGMSNSLGEAAQIGHISVPLLVAVGSALVWGMVRAVRLRNALDPVYLLLAATVFFLGPLGLVFPKELLRLTAMPLALLPAILAGPSTARSAEEVAE